MVGRGEGVAEKVSISGATTLAKLGKAVRFVDKLGTVTGKVGKTTFQVSGQVTKKGTEVIVDTAKGVVPKAFEQGTKLVVPIDKAVSNNVIRNALLTGDTTVDITLTGTKVSWTGDWMQRGLNFEDEMAKILPEGSRLPRNFPTFDFVDKTTRTAISVKTLDTMTPAVLEKPNLLFSRVKGYVDKAISFQGDQLSGELIERADYDHVVINLGIPANTSKRQMDELIKAQNYANSVGVNLIIIKVK